MRSLLPILALTICVGAKPRSAVTQLPCDRPDTARNFPQALPDLSGTWDLELHATDSVPARLVLQLRATDSAQRTALHPIDQKIHHDASYLYLGTLIGDARSVGVGRVSEVSWDPSRPGVKATWHLGSKPELHFNVGTEENDRTKLSLDGWVFWIDARTVSPNTMSGTWEAGVHVIGQVQGGWWCAAKRPV
jgi:hypothetical protein